MMEREKRYSRRRAAFIEVCGYPAMNHTAPLRHSWSVVPASNMFLPLHSDRPSFLGIRHRSGSWAAVWMRKWGAEGGAEEVALHGCPAAYVISSASSNVRDRGDLGYRNANHRQSYEGSS